MIWVVLNAFGEIVLYLPNFGTEEAVGGATSTRIKVSTMKLPNKLVAGNVQWSAVISGQLSPKSSRKAPHSSPIRASYGIFFVNITSDAYFASVIVVPHVESRNHAMLHSTITALNQSIFHKHTT